ncbi:M66 family metalloprotease [Vibrio kasasachensis]|uniref:M66 family metalloprotease n=1 Tax=Vibrio kasasachensis TaxID=2910248 RepID=UPI003D109252
MKLKKVSLLAVLIGSTLSVNSYATLITPLETLSFLSQSDQQNSLSGSLQGMVKFAQTHTIDPVGNAEQEMPRLVSNRRTLVMFMPSDEQNTISSISLIARDANGTTLGELKLAEPELLPKADKLAQPTAELPDVTYSKNAWSVSIPWNWLKPGLQLSFVDQLGNEGYLSTIDIGAENEIMVQNIRLGMLTPPREQHRFEKEQKLVADYFQKVPVSKIIVGNYSPMFFEKIVLSNGTTYTDASAVEGGVYSGDMRENIGKNLISMGIDNANFGITSSDGATHWQPQYFNQYVVHVARGKYTNGVVNHGLSGGNGMATLINSVGNEFSHELGHAYGMGHYPGGGMWSTHNENSGWGWDAFNERFIANFFWTRTGNASNQGYETPPFADIYRFNTDTMGGGSASSSLSQYTLHTGYSQKRIQQRFEKTGRISESSSTGYMIWDEAQKKMVEMQDEKRLKPIEFGVPVTTLVGFYDPKGENNTYIYPALNGSFGYVYDFGEVKGGQCWVDVTYQNGDLQRIGVEGLTLRDGHMNKFHFNVPTERDPVSATISCPEQDVMENYELWRTELLGTNEFKKWSYSRQGEIGDIYRTDDGKRYFELTRNGYWYFPSGNGSNANWKFRGYEADFKAEYTQLIEEMPYDTFGIKELDSRLISKPVVEPYDAVIIGEEFAYQQVKSSVTIYQHGNYQGKTEVIEKDTPQLLLDNNASSIKLGNETLAITYEGKNFTGISRLFREDTSFMTGSNDTATSIKLIDTREPYACVYQAPNFLGEEMCFTEKLERLPFEGDIRSVRVFNGAMIDLLSGKNITGDKLTIREDRAELGEFDDVGSSARMTPLACVYPHGDFGGTPQCYSEDVPQLSPNNGLSSIKLYNGAEVRLFDKSNFGEGLSVLVSETTGWIDNFNDKASSLKFTEVLPPESIDGEIIGPADPVEPDLPTNPPVNNSERAMWKVSLKDGESAITGSWIAAGYRQNLYFISLSSTVYGVKTPITDGKEGYSLVRAYAISPISNRPISIKFRAQKVTKSGGYQMNDTLGGDKEAKLKLSFHKSDNPSLKSGKYFIEMIVHARDPQNSEHNIPRYVKLTVAL